MLLPTKTEYRNQRIRALSNIWFVFLDRIVYWTSTNGFVTGTPIAFCGRITGRGFRICDGFRINWSGRFCNRSRISLILTRNTDGWMLLLLAHSHVYPFFRISLKVRAKK
jgi:hypothetical protein